MKDKQDNRRQYVRLKHVFSVRFSIVHLQSDLPGLDWIKGWTSNVSRGGIGLETDALDESTIRFLNKEDIYLDLRIKTPFDKVPIKAICDIAWFEPMKKNPACYFIGMKFRSITSKDLKKILKPPSQWHHILASIFRH